MLRNCFAGALALTVLLGLPIQAHHGVDHNAPPVTPPAPVVQAAPVVIPPPVVVPPPPVVQVPVPVTAPIITLQLPVISPPSTILSTDTVGILSGVNASKFQQIPSSPLTKESLAALSAPDSRYQFTGEWLLFSSQYSAYMRITNGYQPVSFAAHDDLSQHVRVENGQVEHIEVQQPKLTAPAFMPTKEASFTKVNDEHLALHSGAVIVRASARPVFVATEIRGDKVLTRIGGGALAMVSVFDEKTTVLNLTDQCCGALVLYMPSNSTNKQHSLGIKAGQIAEVYAPDDRPVSNLVATKVDVNERIGHDYGLFVGQCHYVRALKKFNLTSVLTKQDLDRVLKTAAAIACVRR